MRVTHLHNLSFGCELNKEKADRGVTRGRVEGAISPSTLWTAIIIPLSKIVINA